jgi:FADH2 O2-dependent halogenase
VLSGKRDSAPFELTARFVIDASGPGGFLARQLSIPSALAATHTRSSLVYSHFAGARMMVDLLPQLPAGPYPDDWAAVHHIIDEGWMYSLRFDDGVTSAGFLLTPGGVASLGAAAVNAEEMWRELLRRYPVLDDAFGRATPLMPIGYRKNIQHRLARAGGERWLLMPHAFAFVDPLFSTGIAWSLRAVERLALAFESAARGTRVPGADFLERYDRTLSAEADQIDLVVAGAYEATAHFDLFAAQAMLYFAAVSFAEAKQRLAPTEADAWSGFLGVGDPVLNNLPAESFARLSRITQREGRSGSEGEREEFVDWLTAAIEPRNIAGLANRRRANLYPVDFEALVDAHDRLGMTRSHVLAALPRLRGMSGAPDFPGPRRRKIDLAEKPGALPFFPRADGAPQRSQQESGHGAG